jgi:hypothetical protein
MLNLAIWLKKNNFNLDQVQTFTPTPMAMATTMYHTRKNPLHKVTEDSEVVETARAGKVRTLHKAFLRFHDPANWPILREALVRMGRNDLIGSGDKCLVPRWEGAATGGMAAGQRMKAGKPASGSLRRPPIANLPLHQRGPKLAAKAKRK